ncbi:type II toxin-antitoxin system VapC family toxin [Gemmatimonas sp.]
MILERTVYLESSALLTWLFDEPVHADVVRAAVNEAHRVVTSALTLVECHRAIHRAASTARLSQVEALALKQYLSELASSWLILSLDDSVLDRASGAFSGPLIRTLDALHVASALEVAREFGPIMLISLDERVRLCAAAAGLVVIPTLI